MNEHLSYPPQPDTGQTWRVLLTLGSRLSPGSSPADEKFCFLPFVANYSGFLATNDEVNTDVVAGFRMIDYRMRRENSEAALNDAVTTTYLGAISLGLGDLVAATRARITAHPDAVNLIGNAIWNDRRTEDHTGTLHTILASDTFNQRLRYFNNSSQH